MEGAASNYVVILTDVFSHSKARNFTNRRKSFQEPPFLEPRTVEMSA